MRRAADDDDVVMNDVVARLHDALERQAAVQLRRAFGNRLDAVTLEPAALVNEVFIRLLDDSSANIERLKGLGIEVVSHARSSKTVYARLRVEDLELVAGLGFVRLIEPATF